MFSNILIGPFESSGLAAQLLKVKNFFFKILKEGWKWSNYLRKLTLLHLYIQSSYNFFDESDFENKPAR